MIDSGRAGVQDPWQLDGAQTHRGGPALVPRERAPIGRLLGYRRSRGQSPAPSDPAVSVADGWRVDLGGGWLGDMLLGLGAIQALADADERGGLEVCYRGPRPKLVERCSLPVVAKFQEGAHIFDVPGPRPITVRPAPEATLPWLDLRDDGLIEVHSALPMRYYLDLENRLGRRLPRQSDPNPRFVAPSARRDRNHVVLVATTSMPERKDYGITQYVALAQQLAERLGPDTRFSVVTAPGTTMGSDRFADLPVDVHSGIDATECVDLFASARVVVGNDTGLTHLAALSVGPGGEGPAVVGVYGRHSYAKWTTGSDRHHAVTTWFSRMLAACDRDAYRDGFADTTWDGASEVRAILPETVAGFAAEVAA